MFKNTHTHIYACMNECIGIRWCGDIPIIPLRTSAQNANHKKEKCKFSEKAGKHHLFNKPIKWTPSVARYIRSVCFPTGCQGTHLVMHDSFDIAHREARPQSNHKQTPEYQTLGSFYHITNSWYSELSRFWKSREGWIFQTLPRDSEWSFLLLNRWWWAGLVAQTCSFLFLW